MPVIQSGVRPTDLEDTRAPARTVQHCVKAEMFAVEIGDEEGQRIKTVLFRIGNMWYHDPDGQNWVRKLRPVAKDNWLTRSLNESVASSGPVAVPKQDTVDVMSGKKK
jgi:hypothetical protein